MLMIERKSKNMMKRYLMIRVITMYLKNAKLNLIKFMFLETVNAEELLVSNQLQQMKDIDLGKNF